MNFKKLTQTAVIIALVAVLCGSAQANTTGYAWSENTGWANFDPTGGGVTVYDDHLEGYVWHENIGWIRLGTFTAGTAHTYTNGSATDYGVNNNGFGVLTGYGWSENAGWINFGPTGAGVLIGAGGSLDGYAWGENVGWIHFKNASPAYNAVTTWTAAVPIPAAPTGLAAAAASQTQINLNWTDNSGSDETGFKIFRNGILIFTTGADVSTYSDSGLTCGTTYNYEVKATNASGDSAASADSGTTMTCSGTPPSGDPPAAPSDISVMVITTDQIVITWRDNSDNEDGFIIERYDPGRGWVLVGATGPDAVSFTDTVPYKWLFQYRVAARNANGDAYSEAVTVTHWAPEDPHVPYNIRVAGTQYAFGDSITVPENTGAGTFIGTISSDDDTPGGDGHTYSLWSPADGPSYCNDWFYIQGSSLFLKKAFDYETKPGICTINIQARDSHGNFRTDHIVVNVADTDDPPSDIRLSRNTVYENLPAGTEVGKFSAADDEGDTEHSYSLTEGEGDSGNSFFVIEGNVLKTKAVLDYETGTALSIRVTSRAASGGSVTRQFVIEVLDAPDPPAVSEIADQSTDDEVSATVNFTVSDQDTSANYLTVSGKSDNQDVLPDANITFGGSGENRTLTLTPIAGKAGTANITVTVSDGAQKVSTEFKLTVTTGPNIKSEIRTDSGTVAPGGILSFTAVISNTGDRAAENVTFTIPVPENTEFVSGTASAGSVLRQSRGVSYRAETNEAEWSGDIPAGESAEIAFEVRVNPDAERGSSVVISQGSVSYDGGSPAGSSAASDPIPVTVESCLKGDADGNGILELRDAVISLQAAAGIIPEDICPDADVSGDRKIGAEEAVYILNNL